MEKIFYERRVYESLDDVSRIVGYISKIKEKQDSWG